RKMLLPLNSPSAVMSIGFIAHARRPDSPKKMKKLTPNWSWRSLSSWSEKGRAISNTRLDALPSGFTRNKYQLDLNRAFGPDDELRWNALLTNRGTALSL